MNKNQIKQALQEIKEEEKEKRKEICKSILAIICVILIPICWMWLLCFLGESEAWLELSLFIILTLSVVIFAGLVSK